MTHFTESTVEEAALEWLHGLGYSIAFGADLLDGIFAERANASTVILEKRLRNALQKINHDLPPEALEEAFRKLTKLDALLPIDRNHRFHHALVNGIAVEYPKKDGSIGYTNVRVIGFAEPDTNDWLA